MLLQKPTVAVGRNGGVISMVPPKPVPKRVPVRSKQPQLPRPRHTPRALPGMETTGVKSNGENMGFLAKIGDAIKGVSRVASFIPGPHQPFAIAATAGITASEAARGVGRFSKPKLMKPSNFAQDPDVIGGVPPNFGVPTGQIPNGGFDPFGDLIDFPRFQNMFGGGQNGQVSGNGLANTLSELGMPNAIVLPAGQKVIADAPPGYVVVTMPDGSKKAVLKDIARKLGMWKSRSKPPISASDWKKLKTASRVKNKAKKIAMAADFKCVKK